MCIETIESGKSKFDQKNSNFCLLYEQFFEYVIILGLDKHIFEHKVVNIFLPIGFTYVLGAQKNRH